MTGPTASIPGGVARLRKMGGLPRSPALTLVPILPALGR